MGLDSDAALLAALTTALGWTMVFAGSRKRVLELRRRRRRCPSCGRQITGRVCNHH